MFVWLDNLCWGGLLCRFVWLESLVWDGWRGMFGWIGLLMAFSRESRAVALR